MTKAKAIMLFQLRNRSARSIAGLDDLMIRADRLVEARQHGEHTRRKAGLGDNFWQFRDYESASDRSQDIDWRQSAKSNHIYVRERELQSAQDNYIWVDKNPGMAFCSHEAEESKLSRAQILAMGLALLLTRGGENICLAGTDIRGHSIRALENFGSHLIEDPAISEFDIRRNANVFLIGDFVHPIAKIEQQIAQLSEHMGRGFLLQILDPAEINLPYRGRVIFEGHDTLEPDTEIHNIGSVRKQYKDRISQHISAVESVCKKYGWYYALHPTDQSARDCLTHLVEAQNR